jgi:predicted thioesterase
VKSIPVGQEGVLWFESAAVRAIAGQLEAVDEAELVACGRHQRRVVDLDRFLAAVQSKSAAGWTRGTDVA